MREPFGEGVYKRQQCAAKGKVECEGIGKKHHHQERKYTQAAKQGDGLPRFNSAGGQWAIFGAFYVLVPIPICKVVDGTPSGPHEEHTQCENDDIADAWATVTGKPEGPVCGPKQE